MVRRDVERDIATDSGESEENANALVTLDTLLTSIAQAGEESVFTVDFLDPHGHSMILDSDAIERELTEDELAELPIGPDPAVFSSDDV